MRLATARQIARSLLVQMEPHVERIEVLGSIRRRRPEVRDIELLAIPKWVEEPDPDNLFGGVQRINQLHQWAMAEAERGWIRWIKPGTSDVVPWRPRAEGRYWRAQLSTGIKLDLFLAAPENYGAIQLIRTGSADFSRAVMGYARDYTSYRFHDGYLREANSAGEAGAVICTPDEKNVFELLGLQYVPPADRLCVTAIMPLRCEALRCEALAI